MLNAHAPVAHVLPNSMLAKVSHCMRCTLSKWLSLIFPLQTHNASTRGVATCSCLCDVVEHVAETVSVPSFEALVYICCTKLSRDLTAELVEIHHRDATRWQKSKGLISKGKISQWTTHFETAVIHAGFHAQSVS